MMWALLSRPLTISTNKDTYAKLQKDSAVL